MADQRRIWQRLMGPLWRRIRLLVSRGVLKLVDDSLKLQGAQVALLGDEPAWAERFQQYGFTGHPHLGAEAIVVGVGSARAHLVALAIDDRRYRLKELAEGEVAMYDDLGNVIVFKRDKIVVNAVKHLEVTAPTCQVTTTTTHDGNVTIKGNVKVDGDVIKVTGDIEVTGGVKVTGDIEVSGGVKVTGDITDGVGSMQKMRDTYNSHNHSSAGGSTGPPNPSM